MNKYLCLTLCAALIGLLAPVSASADPAPVALTLTPHRAIYKVSLARVKSGSGIHDVSGTMFFDLTDACDGWALQQHMNLKFALAEENLSEVSSDVVTWESKDGSSFRFNVKRVTDGSPDEAYKGQATMTEQGGVAHYAFPKDKEEIKIPQGAVFPMGHTKMIIEKAMAGEKLFSRRVFDASDAEGSADVSTFIGARGDKKEEASLSETVRDNPLLKGQVWWSARLASFLPKDNAAEPDYEMDLALQANGIARSMTIDYGDFAVAGVLVSLEAGRPFPCGEAK